MKKLMIAMMVVGVLGASAFAGDPGGAPGITPAGVFAVRTYGDATWFAPNDGTLRSGAIGNSQSTTLEVAFSLDQNATLSFSSYASSESGYDYLRFYLNNEQKDQKSGENNEWASETYKLFAGSHVIRWVYSKDSSSSRGSDAGFVRDVKLTTESGAVLGEILVNGLKIISSAIRANDPTILDVTYMVKSDKPTVNVRSLAFEDGERSFWKVVRPETFVKDTDGNKTALNIGDGIAANVEHKLSWKVSADWKTDLAKVKFEVLTSDMAQLPLKTITIPAVAGKLPSLTVAVNDQTDANIFNALLWHYADAAKDLKIQDGYLYTTAGTLLSGRDSVGSADRMAVLRYIYDKMGWEALENMIVIQFVRDALRKQNLSFNSSTRNLAIPKGTLPTSLYIGEKAYWAIDLQTGASEYFDSVPLEGWGDEYKTTKLLMRRIEPGTVKLGGTKPVTLTKPFYIGVFEVTQKQYALINGSNPSQYEGDMRPVECVRYNDIRGKSKGAEWPSGTEFDDTSWLGKLKAKLGIGFDLPTESQWEYACRAGTTSEFNNGGSSDEDLDVLGRYKANRNDGKGGFSEHTIVGSYLPNAWGLYDMHGNVFEWILDWSGSFNGDLAVDFGGPSSGSDRVFRGGKWDYYNYSCGASYRTSTNPSNSDSGIGFRLCCSAPAGLQ